MHDRKDRRVFMQNFKRWYLMRGPAQMRNVSTSLQMVTHLFRSYSHTYSDVSAHGVAHDTLAVFVCVYYYITYYKAVRVCGWG